jgi:hypothetical protein
VFTFVVWAIGLWIIYRIVMFLWVVVSEFFTGLGEGRRERNQRKRQAEAEARYRQIHADDMAFCCGCGAGNHPSVPFCYLCGKWMGGRSHDADTRSDRDAAAKAAAHSWNKTAIRADFVELAASDRKDRIKLWYTLTNTTDADYRIQNMSGITTAVSAHGKTDFLYAFNEGMISLEMPLIIPANGKIRAMLTVALQTDKSVPDGASEAAMTIYKNDVMSFLRSKYSKMRGFVLMDEGTRYEIDFPAGAWSEQ